MIPTERIDKWKEESAINRAHTCRVFLMVHGFLSESENVKVKQRLAKWAKNYQRRARPRKS